VTGPVGLSGPLGVQVNMKVDAATKLNRNNFFIVQLLPWKTMNPEGEHRLYVLLSGISSLGVRARVVGATA